MAGVLPPKKLIGKRVCKSYKCFNPKHDHIGRGIKDFIRLSKMHARDEKFIKTHQYGKKYRQRVDRFATTEGVLDGISKHIKIHCGHVLL